MTTSSRLAAIGAHLCPPAGGHAPSSCCAAAPVAAGQEAPPHVVVAGATGLAGRAAVLHYYERGWRVTAVSRREPDYHQLPAHATLVADAARYRHLPLDLLDREACLSDLGEASRGASHVVYAAAIDLDVVWSAGGAERVRKNNVQMLSNFLDGMEAGAGVSPHPAPLLAAEPRGGADPFWQSELRHVSVLHGTGYYGAYVKIDPRRFPSSEAAPPVPGNQARPRPLADVFSRWAAFSQRRLVRVRSSTWRRRSCCGSGSPAAAGRSRPGIIIRT